MRQLILSGGGGEQDSRPLDEAFARQMPASRPLLYLPIALDPREHAYAACHRWIRSVFAPLGRDDIVMWDDVAGKGATDLDAFAGIYIGGGNAFKLLHDLREARLLDPLRRFALGGGLVYGGSAGAILLGKDITTAAHADPNEVGLRDTTGLDLLDGYSVWPHYRQDDDDCIAAHVERYGLPVIALSERSGLYVRDDLPTALGSAPTVVFRAQSRDGYPSSMTIDL